MGPKLAMPRLTIPFHSAIQALFVTSRTANGLFKQSTVVYRSIPLGEEQHTKTRKMAANRCDGHKSYLNKTTAKHPVEGGTHYCYGGTSSASLRASRQRRLAAVNNSLETKRPARWWSPHITTGKPAAIQPRQLPIAWLGVICDRQSPASSCSHVDSITNARVG